MDTSLKNVKFFLEIIVLLGCIQFYSCQEDPQYLTILERMGDHPSLTTFFQLILDLELDGIYGLDADQVTIFAPSDDGFIAAFEQLNSTMPNIENDEVMLREIILHHTVVQQYNSSQLLDGTELRTFVGLPMFVDAGFGQIRLESLGSGANVVERDINVGGVVMHVVDFLLLPFQFP